MNDKPQVGFVDAAPNALRLPMMWLAFSWQEPENCIAIGTHAAMVAANRDALRLQKISEAVDGFDGSRVDDAAARRGVASGVFAALLNLSRGAAMRFVSSLARRLG